MSMILIMGIESDVIATVKANIATFTFKVNNNKMASFQ